MLVVETRSKLGSFGLYYTLNSTFVSYVLKIESKNVITLNKTTDFYIVNLV